MPKDSHLLVCLKIDFSSLLATTPSLVGNSPVATWLVPGTTVCHVQRPAHPNREHAGICLPVLLRRIKKNNRVVLFTVDYEQNYYILKTS